MNNINDELLQMKIEGLCVEYDEEMSKEDLICFAEEFCEELIEYGDELVGRDNLKGELEEKDTLLFAACSTLRLIVVYLDREEQEDIEYEGYLATISAHMYNELCDFAIMFAEKDPDNVCVMLFATAEFFWLLFRVLGEPLSKKVFANSQIDSE